MRQAKSPGVTSQESLSRHALDVFIDLLRILTLVVVGIVGLHLLGIVSAFVLRGAVLGHDVHIYNSLGMRALFPYYDEFARAFAVAFLLAGPAIWVALKSLLAKFTGLALAWSLTFTTISVFHPFQSVGLFVPGYALFSSLRAGNAPTRFAPGFQWAVFNDLPSGLEEKDLVARLGPPLARFKTRDMTWSGTGAHAGDEILLYSDTAIVRDPGGVLDWSFWQVQVNLDATGRVKSTWFGFRRDSTD